LQRTVQAERTKKKPGERELDRAGNKEPMKNPISSITITTQIRVIQAQTWQRQRKLAAKRHALLQSLRAPWGRRP